MIIEGQKVVVKWNNANRKHFESIVNDNGNKKYKYTKQGDEFLVDIKDLNKGSKSLVSCNCDNPDCDSDTFVREYGRANRTDKQFCTDQCARLYFAKKKISERPIKKCEWCNEEYSYPKNAEDKTRFCSRKCLIEWQKVNFKGESSSRYVERFTIPCDWCGEEIERTEYQLSTREHNFCNNECTQNWYKEVFVKLPETIERNRKTMLNNLANGNIAKTNTKPHRIICELLDKMKISYTNEKIIDYFAFDIYLDDFDLYIEINGGYWHVDNRQYEEIEYEVQVNRIISDKRKNTLLKNKLNKNILYLWEYDIENNIELCEKLISKFIESNGLLTNYHSFNFLLHNNELKENNDLIIPYMEYTPEELEKCIHIEIKDKVSKRQKDKWITFNCEFCGEPKDQLIITYNKSNHHYCSIECHNFSQRKNWDKERDESELIHNCANCNEQIKVDNYVHQKLLCGEQKNVFCSQRCKHEWDSKNNVGINNPLYTSIEKECGYCKEKYIVPNNRKDKSKYCSHECRQKASRNRTKMNCLNCDKEIYKTPTDIKKNKSGEFFCSHECSNEYRSKKAHGIRNCEICNESYETKKKSTQRFCSINCQGVWQSLNLVGENANNYKNGEYVVAH